MTDEQMLDGLIAANEAAEPVCAELGCEREAGHEPPHRSRTWNAQLIVEEIDEWTKSRSATVTDDEIRELHRGGDDKTKTLCEIALGGGSFTAPIARHALAQLAAKRRSKP